MEAIVLRRELACGAAPSALFAVLADSDRLYRTLGQVVVSREPVVGEGSARFLLRARTGPRAIPFTEIPPQWSQPSLLVTKRVLHQGVLASIATRFSLTPLMQGTRLLIEMQIESRLPQLAWLIKLYGQGTLWHLGRTLARIDTGILRGEKTQLRVAELSPEPLAVAHKATQAALLPEDRPLLEELVALLRRSDDLDVDSLRLPSLCESLVQNEQTVLRLLLVASAHGLLQLSFDVLCPSCRQPAGQYDHLSELSDEAFCSLCELRVPVEFAGNVEVTFRPAAPLRRLARPLYASESPSTELHVLTQMVLPSSSTLTLTVPNEPSEFRLWARGGATGLLRVSTLGPQQASIEVGDSIVPAQVEIAMGGTLEIAHKTNQARHFKLERSEWNRQKLLAHRVTLHPLFRRLFPTEVPKPAVQLAVPSVTLWMSEFPSLGELCAALGDSGAFRQVLELEQAVCRAIEPEQGAVTHNSGSSLTVAFESSEAALRAAVAAQRAVMAVRTDNPFAPLLAMRIGLFAGPATLVCADRRLDYFGQTVAICERLCNEAHGGDILLPANLTALASEQAGVKAGPIFSVSGKGLPAPIAVTRLCVESTD